MTGMSDFFARNAGGGGTGAPAFKFDQNGSGVIGTVVDLWETFVTIKGTKDPKLDKNGDKQPQLVVTLQTELRNWQGLAKIPVDDDGNARPASDDDGKRSVWVKYQMIRAIADALVKTGGDELLQKGLEKGGKLGVRKIDEQDLGGGNSMFVYDAVYTPPVQAAGGEMFGQANAAQQAAQAPTAPPAAPPVAFDQPAAQTAPAPTNDPWAGQQAAQPQAPTGSPWAGGEEPPF